MVGTLFNTFAVAVGASAGLALGARWSSELKDKMFVVLGLFTLAIGSMMALETAQPIDLFLALRFTSVGCRDYRIARRRGPGGARCALKVNSWWTARP